MNQQEQDYGLDGFIGEGSGPIGNGGAVYVPVGGLLPGETMAQALVRLQSEGADAEIKQHRP